MCTASYRRVPRFQDYAFSKSLTFPMYVYTIDRIQTFRKAYAEKYNARNTGNNTEFFHMTSNKK